MSLQEIPKNTEKEEFEPSWMLSGLNTPVCVQLLVSKPEYIIGSSNECDATLSFSSTISGRHIRLIDKSGNCIAEDLSSTNGSLLNGYKLTPGETKVVHDGDHLQIASFVFQIEKIRRQ